MKWLWWGLALLVLATALREGFDFLAPPAQAFRAYRQEAESRLREGRSDSRFGGIEGEIVGVTYVLESAERIDGESVRLVVVEAVRFEKPDQRSALEGHVARSRQSVVMTRREDGWRITSLVDEPAE